MAVEKPIIRLQKNFRRRARAASSSAKLNLGIWQPFHTRIVRAFTSFSSAAEEASLSRIFAGQRFRFDQTAGQRLGREIADFVADHFLARIHSKDDR